MSHIKVDRYVHFDGSMQSTANGTLTDQSDCRFRQQHGRGGMSMLPNVEPTWFASDGHFLGVLPADCISDCSHCGPCDADVAYWRERLDFTVPRDRAIAYL